MIRFLLPSTDTPWQKAEELGLKDKLAMKVRMMKKSNDLKFKFWIFRWTQEILTDTHPMG